MIFSVAERGVVGLVGMRDESECTPYVRGFMSKAGGDNGQKINNMMQITNRDKYIPTYLTSHIPAYV
jgi:hypothetical protein